MDYVDYIISSPYTQPSSATLAYKRLYRKIINLTVEHSLNSQDGFIDPEIVLIRRNLQNKLYKIRNLIPTKPDRDQFRKTEKYKQLKINWYNKAINNSLSLKNS
jgi:hypothetical protein